MIGDRDIKPDNAVVHRDMKPDNPVPLPRSLRKLRWWQSPLGGWEAAGLFLLLLASRVMPWGLPLTVGRMLWIVLTGVLVWVGVSLLTWPYQRCIERMLQQLATSAPSSPEREPAPRPCPLCELQAGRPLPPLEPADLPHVDPLVCTPPIVLSREAGQAFLDLVAKPPEPTPIMKALLRGEPVEWPNIGAEGAEAPEGADLSGPTLVQIHEPGGTRTVRVVGAPKVD